MSIFLLGQTQAWARSLTNGEAAAPALLAAPSVPVPPAPALDDRFAPYSCIVLGRWGDPLLSGAPGFAGAMTLAARTPYIDSGTPMRRSPPLGCSPSPKARLADSP